MTSATAATESSGAMNGAIADPRELYIELLKNALTHTAYALSDTRVLGGNRLTRRLLAEVEKRGLIPVRIGATGQAAREQGRDWPVFAQTMVGRARLDSLQRCVETVIEDRVPGDLIETGVWRGGATIFMRGLLKVHGVCDRTVFVADSFRGLPKPDAERYPADAGATWHVHDPLAVSLEQVQENFRRYGLLDEQVRFLQGWFSETLPTVADRQWAVMRLDGDMYESTMDALTNLYSNLAPGGFVIIDDFAVTACREAVYDYRRANGITEELQEIDWTGTLWRKRA